MGSVPAIKVSAQYRGLGTYEPGIVTLTIYAFEHNGMVYAVELDTTADWLAKESFAFAQLIKSLRFTNVA